MLIPLWPLDVTQARNELAATFPVWAEVQVAYSSVYLGVVGPEGGKDFWDKAILKFEKRASEWGKVGLGLQYATLAYSIYILPILSFLAQFKVLDDEVFQAEASALAHMVPGPYRWMLKEDFFSLATHYG